MKATLYRDDATTGCHHSARPRPQPPVDLSVDARPPIRQDWRLWCDVAVAGAVWLVLFGLALVALSAVTRTQPASYPTGPRPSEVVTPGVSEMRSSSAGAESVR